MDSKAVRDSTRAFYNGYGWKRDRPGGHFLGEILYEDLSTPVQEYIASNELRYREVFTGGGELFLDAGCGGKPRRAMSAGYRLHICVDVSRLGLEEARLALGQNGRYVLADLVALPFVENCMDGALASHSLYHVEASQQPAALAELYRVLQPGRSILVFYASDQNLLTLLHNLARTLRGAIQRAKSHSAPDSHDAGNPRPELYAGTQPPWKLTETYPSTSISSLMALTKWETRLLAALRLQKLGLRLANYLERTFPRAMVYLGKYIAIVIEKPNRDRGAR